MEKAPAGYESPELLTRTAVRASSSMQTAQASGEFGVVDRGIPYR